MAFSPPPPPISRKSGLVMGAAAHKNKPSKQAQSLPFAGHIANKNQRILSGKRESPRARSSQTLYGHHKQKLHQKESGVHMYSVCSSSTWPGLWKKDLFFLLLHLLLLFLLLLFCLGKPLEGGFGGACLSSHPGTKTGKATLVAVVSVEAGWAVGLFFFFFPGLLWVERQAGVSLMGWPEWNCR